MYVTKTQTRFKINHFFKNRCTRKNWYFPGYAYRRIIAFYEQLTTRKFRSLDVSLAPCFFSNK